jgi:tetratricopeptide (TPR) repeat protein
MMQPTIIEIEQFLESDQPQKNWQAIDMYIMLGHIDQALYAATQIVQLDNNQQQAFRAKYPEILRLGAEFAEEICDFSKAAYYWEQLVQQQPQISDAWYGLALAKANLGAIPEAQRAIDRSLQIDPRYLPAQQLLANIRNLSLN